MALIPVGRLTVATPETMAESIRRGTVATDAVDERIGPVAGQIINDLDPSVFAGPAETAVGERLNVENILRAFPEEAVSYTANDRVPMRWTHRVLNDPVGDVVGDTIAGTWSGSSRRAGDVPVLSPEGKLHESQLPASLATREYVEATVERFAVPSSVAVSERVVRGEFPIFGARVAAARAAGTALAVVFAGSSTTAEAPGYVARLTALLQDVYPVDAKSAPSWSTTATFTNRSEPGVHAYSAGEGGAVALDYLTDDECDRIAALSPGMLLHMVGANDYWRSVPPATYKAQVLARLAYLDSVMTAPCQHVLVQTYPRAGNPGETRYLYPWDEYGQALDEIAATRPDTVLVDLTAQYAAVGVDAGTRLDPLVLIREDGTHQTPAGYRFMADLLAGYLTA